MASGLLSVINNVRMRYIVIESRWTCPQMHASERKFLRVNWESQTRQVMWYHLTHCFEMSPPAAVVNDCISTVCILCLPQSWRILFILGVPGGKVYILGGQCIGHSKQKTVWTCVLFRTLSEIEAFECTTAKLLIRKRYYEYVLFLIPVFIVQVTELVQFIINVRKFHRQHQCTLQLVRGHGVLFVWVRLAVPLRTW